MNLYNGLVKLNKNNKIEDLKIIRDGFSFNALIYNPFWFLFHKMWKEFVGFIVIFLALSIFSNMLFDILWIEVFLFFMIALNSRAWFLDHLVAKQHYQLIAMVFAKSEAEAKIKLINQISDGFDLGAKDVFAENIFNPQMDKEQINKKHRKIKSKFFQKFI